MRYSQGQFKARFPLVGRQQGANLKGVCQYRLVCMHRYCLRPEVETGRLLPEHLKRNADSVKPLLHLRLSH